MCISLRNRGVTAVAAPPSHREGGDDKHYSRKHDVVQLKRHNGAAIVLAFQNRTGDKIVHNRSEHSHNTKRLTVEEMKELLLKLTFIREDLGLQPRAHAKEIRSE